MRLLAFALSILILTSCTQNQALLSPKPALAGLTREQLTPDPDIAYWRKCYYSTPCQENRKFYRNEIVRRMMRVNDEYFVEWSQKLYSGRAVANTTADMATSVMSAFVAASGASSAKTLGLVMSGISGTRLAFDSNIYLEKSVGALISQMNTGRASVDVQITQYLRLPVSEYSLEEGIRDTIRYYEAGTLAYASDALHSNAYQSAEKASALVERAKGDGLIAPPIIEQSIAREKRLEQAVNEVVRPEQTGHGDNTVAVPKTKEQDAEFKKVSQRLRNEILKVTNESEAAKLDEENDTIRKILNGAGLYDSNQTPSYNELLKVFQTTNSAQAEKLITEIKKYLVQPSS